MSVVVKATCPDCGDCDVRGDHVRLYARDGQVPVSYGFNCPVCGLHRIKEATSAISALLQGAGIRLERIPAEVDEAHDGPMITEDDLARFQDTFDADLEDLLRSGQQGEPDDAGDPLDGDGA